MCTVRSYHEHTRSVTSASTIDWIVPLKLWNMLVVTTIAPHLILSACIDIPSLSRAIFLHSLATS
jgi:hypothetical protein